MLCILLFAASSCFTSTIVLLLRLVVTLCCVGIVSGMFACLLDLCGTMNKCLKVIKDYSIGNVITGKSSFTKVALELLLAPSPVGRPMYTDSLLFNEPCTLKVIWNTECTIPIFRILSDHSWYKSVKSESVELCDCLTSTSFHSCVPSGLTSEI